MEAGVRRSKGEGIKRLKAMEKEDRHLKKLVDDLSRDNLMLKELVERTW